MRNHPDKSLGAFDKKYKLLGRALGGVVIRDKDIAVGLFPDWGAASAQARWSACKSGTKEFPKDKLGTLLKLVDPQGVVKSLGFDIWDGSPSELRDAFIGAGLI